MSHDMTKPTKWVCAQRRPWSDWTSDQPGHLPSLISLRCALNEWLRTQAFIMQTAKSLIRLGGCQSWSESSLGAQAVCWFCHVAAQIMRLRVKSESLRACTQISIPIVWPELNILSYINYVPTTEGQVETYRFWCGSRRRRHSVLSALCLLNQWVDFDQTCTDALLGWEKKWLDFGDLDLIFKVTPALWMSNLEPKSLTVPYLEPNNGFWPKFMYCISGIVKRFGDLDPIFKVIIL